MDETRIGGPARAFPTTRWSIVLAARGSADEKRASLDALLRDYWKPLYARLRRDGMTVEDAKDAVQGFVAHLLEKDALVRVDPARGRFRSWLRASLDHWVQNERSAGAALKRGGGRAALDVDALERSLADAPREADVFDREWALAVMERSLARLRAEFADGRRTGPIDVALRFFGFGEPCSYEQAATEAGTTAAQFKAFLHRTRARFREIVRDDIAQTVGDPADVDAEMAELVRVLGRAP
jgi:DNA-directed RNA polymerase specialized sigma24 family protein